MSGTAEAAPGAARAVGTRLPPPRPRVAWLLAASGFLFGAAVLGVLVGPVHIGVGAILRATASHLPFVHVSSTLSRAEDAIVFELRLPRVVLGALVGAMLAGCGAAFQGAFRNPLADPYLLGTAAGAGLGATMVVAYAPADTRPADDGGLDRRPDHPSLRGRDVRRARPVRPAARRARGRRRRGRKPGNRRPPDPAHRDRRGHRRHRGGRRGQRLDRLRRDHRPAHHPAAGRWLLPGAAAVLAAG